MEWINFVYFKGTYYKEKLFEVNLKIIRVFIV